MRLNALAWVVLLLVGVLLLSPATVTTFAADEEDAEVLIRRSKLYSKDVEKVVDKALEYLAQTQNSDGSWGDNQKVCNTSLAGMAFLANGHTTSRGKYAKNVRAAVEFMLNSQGTNGHYGHNNNSDPNAGTHAHGYAMMFMAEAYGMCSRGGKANADKTDKALQESLQKGADLIVASQATCGGWYYQLTGRKDNGHEGSTTVCAAEGLRSARNVGIAVDKKAIELGLDYMKKTYGNGSFAYQYPGKGGNSVALSAAGAVVLISYGDQSKEVQDMINGCRDFLRQNLLNGGNPQVNGFPYYTTFYATQTFHYVGGKDWESWYKSAKQWLLSSRQEDASGKTNYWANGSETQHPAFSTGIAVLILSSPNNYLPIFQK